MKGGTVCRMHGGMTPAVREKARQRVLEVTLRGELEKQGWEPITDPVAALADAAGEAWAWKEVCRRQVSEIRRWEETNAFGGQDLRPVIAVYERSMDRAIDMLAKMVKLGLDHEALRQAKQRPSAEMAAGLMTIMERVLDRLDLTPEQAERVQPAFSAAFKEVAK